MEQLGLNSDFISSFLYITMSDFFKILHHRLGPLHLKKLLFRNSGIVQNKYCLTNYNSAGPCTGFHLGKSNCCILIPLQPVLIQFILMLRILCMSLAGFFYLVTIDGYYSRFAQVLSVCVYLSIYMLKSQMSMI